MTSKSDVSTGQNNLVRFRPQGKPDGPFLVGKVETGLSVAVGDFQSFNFLVAEELLVLHKH